MARKVGGWRERILFVSDRDIYLIFSYLVLPPKPFLDVIFLYSF